jgi:hypothetical protein
VSLVTSLAAVAAASALLRAPLAPGGARPRPGRAVAAAVYSAALFAYLVALLAAAVLAAGVTGTVGAKAAELVAGYGAGLTNQARAVRRRRRRVA